MLLIYYVKPGIIKNTTASVEEKVFAEGGLWALRFDSVIICGASNTPGRILHLPTQHRTPVLLQMR